MILKIATGVAWGVQLLLAIVVLALSMSRASRQYYGSAPTTVKYSSFAGAYGMVAAAVGLAGLFVELVPAIAILVADALSGLFLLGGGIAYSVALKGTECGASVGTNTWNGMEANEMLNLGTDTSADYSDRGFLHQPDPVPALRDICRRAAADQALQYLAFFAVLGTLFLTWRARNRSPVRAIA